MLDVFLVLFTTAAFACLVADRDAVRRRLAALPDDALAARRGPRLGLRPWRLAAGRAARRGLATKWSARLLRRRARAARLRLGGRGAAHRGRPRPGPLDPAAQRAAAASPRCCCCRPSLYTLSWAGWFATDIGYDRHWAAGQPGAVLRLPARRAALVDAVPRRDLRLPQQPQQQPPLPVAPGRLAAAGATGLLLLPAGHRHGADGLRRGHLLPRGAGHRHARALVGHDPDAGRPAVAVAGQARLARPGRARPDRGRHRCRGSATT